MPTKMQVTALAAVALCIVFGFTHGQSLSVRLLLQLSSYVVSGISVVLFFWDRWLWRCRIFWSWLNTKPNLRGTWKGQVLSDWKDPQTGLRRGPIEVYLVVRQTYSSIDARLFSIESSSTSLSVNLVSGGAEVHSLAVTYRNEPRVMLREGSPIHYGGMLLNVRGTPAIKLDGEYWTDRNTKGDAIFSVRVKKVGTDFNDAASFFEMKPVD